MIKGIENALFKYIFEKFNHGLDCWNYEKHPYSTWNGTR